METHHPKQLLLHLLRSFWAVWSFFFILITSNIYLIHTEGSEKRERAKDIVILTYPIYWWIWFTLGKNNIQDTTIILLYIQIWQWSLWHCHVSCFNLNNVTLVFTLLYSIEKILQLKISKCLYCINWLQ
jgi:hypothetical protein